MKKSSITPAQQSPFQQQSLDLSQQQREAQNAQIGQANQTVGQGQQAIGTAQQALSPYLAGSSGMSEFRRALTGNMANAVANTGANAISGARNRAQAAGFGGGGQPLQYGAEAELGQEQANRIAQIPGQVEQQAAPLELQAAGQQAGLAGQENNLANTQLGAARIYNPESYYNTGAQFAGQNYQDYLNQLDQQRKQKSGIWGGLANIGQTVLGNVLPGIFGSKQQTT